MANKVATAKEQPVAVPQDMPDFMKGMSGAGTENIGLKDIETPRLKLLQAVSPEVVEKDLRSGQWYHTVLEEAFPKDLEVVVLYVDTRYLLWRPLHDGGGILARADDGVHWSPPDASFSVRPSKDSQRTVVWKTAKTVQESRLDQWGTYDPSDTSSQPAATFMFNMVVALPQFPHIGPCVLTLQRTGLRPGKKLMGKLKLAQAPSFGLKFVMSSEPETNGANQTFLVPSFQAAGFVQDPAEFKSYQDIHDRFKAEGLKVRDLEGAQEDDRTAPSSEEGDRRF